MKKLVVCALVVISVLFFSCGKGGESKPPAENGQGTLVFTANGEDFVRRGFTDKQGWKITFDKLLVNITDPTAYGEPGEVVLKGAHIVDLAAGDENAEPITVAELGKIAPGNYQSLKFKINRMADGEFKGSSIVMIGTAVKDGKTVPFTIRLDEEMDYDGREGYVGDEIKGLVTAGKTSDVEMTFHFDHVFGDAEAPDDDHINTGSVGFDFFNAFAKDGKVDVSQADLKDAKNYNTLVKALWTLGHLGEGHCHCTNQSSAEIVK